MRSLTASEAALRAYHHPQATSASCNSDNNSDRDSRSTSSQSQCGHSTQPQQPPEAKKQPRISYISSNDNQMNIAMALEGCYQVIMTILLQMFILGITLCPKRGPLSTLFGTIKSFYASDWVM